MSAVFFNLDKAKWIVAKSISNSVLANFTCESGYFKTDFGCILSNLI